MSLEELKETVQNVKKISREILALSENLDSKNISAQRAAQIKINSLRMRLRNENSKIPSQLREINIQSPFSDKPQFHQQLSKIQENISKKNPDAKNEKKDHKFDELERQTLKRMKKKEVKKEKIKEDKPSFYVNLSNGAFGGVAQKMINQGNFKSLKRDLVKANLQLLPTTYVSIIFFTTLITFLIGLFATGLLLFFNIGAEWPIITMTQTPLAQRFLQVFWITLLLPLISFMFMYFYPYLEKSSAENQIEQELPFAAIHMASISGSMIEPSKIFSIIISTHEYPYLEKEFVKLLNEINVYGYDLVSALRNMAFNSPSKKLSELFNGLATTITSGGNLPEFFEKRAQSLLFEYQLEREKYTRTVETFMDIYISVVIAAPMIFMLLLMMMKISGLGISLSAAAITLMMVLGVTGINILFLTFLHLKQPNG